MVLLDQRVTVPSASWLLFSGGPRGARSVLSAVASSMITFTGLVFSITILVLQLASNQFSPRAMRTYLEDRFNQLALGIFLGTFGFALLTLRTVRGTGEDVSTFVPTLSVWTSMALVMLSVGVFIGYLHHIAQSIRAVVVIQRIAEDARGSLARLFPEGIGAETRDPSTPRPEGAPALEVRHPGNPGVVARVDEQELLEAVAKAPVAVVMSPMVGDFLPHGALVFSVWGEPAGVDPRALLRCLEVDIERSHEQDLAYGFRQLVDIALRALSPAVNDPTTATQTLDQFHDLLRRLSTRRFPDPARSIDGRVVLVLPRPSWDDYVHLALDEICGAGMGQLQIRRRAVALLEDVAALAPPFRRGALQSQLRCWAAERADA